MGTVYTATVDTDGGISGTSFDSQQFFNQTQFDPEPMTISDDINGIVQIGGMKVNKSDLDAGYFGNDLKEAYYAQKNGHQSVQKQGNYAPTQTSNVDVHDSNDVDVRSSSEESTDQVDSNYDAQFPEDYVSHIGFDKEEMRDQFDQTQILGAEGFDNLVGEVAEALASGGDGEIQISDEYADKLTEAGFTTASMSTQVDSAVSRIDDYIASNYDFSDEKWSALHSTVWNDPTLMKEIAVETFSDKTDTLDKFLHHLGFSKK